MLTLYETQPGSCLFMHHAVVCCYWFAPRFLEVTWTFLSNCWVRHECGCKELSCRRCPGLLLVLLRWQRVACQDQGRLLQHFKTSVLQFMACGAAAWGTTWEHCGPWLRHRKFFFVSGPACLLGLLCCGRLGHSDRSGTILLY
jgi:hypothetical protein